MQQDALQKITSGKRTYLIVEKLSQSTDRSLFKVKEEGKEDMYIMQQQNKMRIDESILIQHLIEHQQESECLTKFYDLFQQENSIFTIQEYFKGGNLSNLIMEESILYSDIIQIVLDVCKSIRQLNLLGFIHRDIKPDNIFIQMEQDNSKKYKLCNYGEIRQEENQNNTQNTLSATYKAPEWIENKINSGDIWSLGVLIYELFQCQPFIIGDSIQQIQKKILEITQDELDAKINASLVNILVKPILKQMLNKNPSKRPTIQQIQDIFQEQLEEQKQLQIFDQQNDRTELNQQMELNKTQSDRTFTEPTIVFPDDSTKNITFPSLPIEQFKSDKQDILIKQCENCQKTLNQCEQNEQVCQECRRLQLDQYYTNQIKKKDQLKGLDQNLCQNTCIFCEEIVKQYKVIENGQIFHENCLQISKESALKNEMKAVIKQQFQSYFRDNFYFSHQCKCIKLDNYTNYVIGHFSPIMKNKYINSKLHIVNEEQANQLFEQEIKQFEIAIAKYYTIIKINIKNIEENLIIMRLFALFITKDISTDWITNLLQEETYEKSFLILQLARCQNKEKHDCLFHINISQLREFFTRRYDKIGNKFVYGKQKTKSTYINKLK